MSDPTLILVLRSPSEQKAWREGARLALSLVQTRLPQVVAFPCEGTIPAPEVLRVLREVHDMFKVASEVDDG